MASPNEPSQRRSSCPATPGGAHARVPLTIGGPVDRVQVCLRVRGADLDPQVVTRLLGVVPTDSGRPGGVRLKQGCRVKVTTGFWDLEASSGPVAESLETVIRSLLDRLPQDPAVWRKLAAEWRVYLFCGLFLDNWVRECLLSPGLMGALAERGLELQLDIYGA